jgi:poly(A) polymerase
MDKDIWITHVDTVFYLLESWWEKKIEYISPVKIVSGNDLIKWFDLKSGPLIGKLLSEIYESQAIGQIKDREDAFRFAAKWLADNYG